VIYKDYEVGYLMTPTVECPGDAWVDENAPLRLSTQDPADGMSAIELAVYHGRFTLVEMRYREITKKSEFTINLRPLPKGSVYSPHIGFIPVNSQPASA